MVREESGLTQALFANALSISTATLNRYEKNHRLPDSDFLKKLVVDFNCDPNWLLTGEETTSNSSTSMLDKKLISLFNALPADSKEGLVGILDSYVGALKDEKARKAFDSFKKSFMKEIKKVD